MSLHAVQDEYGLEADNGVAREQILERIASAPSLDKSRPPIVHGQFMALIAQDVADGTVSSEIAKPAIGRMCQALDPDDLGFAMALAMRMYHIDVLHKGEEITPEAQRWLLTTAFECARTHSQPMRPAALVETVARLEATVQELGYQVRGVAGVDSPK